MSNTWNDITEWLTTAYPEDILMPIKRGTKHPLFKHINGQWSWGQFRDFVYKNNINNFDVAILLKSICVIDVDKKELIEEMEAKFPVLFTCPQENTKNGKHYYFARSELADTREFMDQRSSVIPGVDFKTRCSTGNPGVIVVAPSKDKYWIHTPWPDDILPTIPDHILRAVARPDGKIASVTFSFPDESRLVVKNNAHIHKFELLSTILDDQDHVEIPFVKGDVESMSELLQFCATRKYSTWPVDVRELQVLADYMCCSDFVTRMLSTGIPSSPTEWICSIAEIGGDRWANASLRHDLVNVKDLCIKYEPLPKSDCWLFPTLPRNPLVEGEDLLRKDFIQYANDNFPECVLYILKKYPSLILAGSSVLSLVCSAIIEPPSDYDFFFCSTNLDDFRIMLNDVCTMDNIKLVARTGSAATLIVGEITIQVILKRFRGPDHVMSSFDIGPSQIFLRCHENTFQVKATSNWVHSIKHMSFWVNFHRWSTSSVSRVFKYYAKGFEVFVPGMERSKFKQILRPVTGVCNLIRVEQAYHGVTRPDAATIKKLVKYYNFWGLHYQSAYEEYVGTRLPYVLLNLIRKGISWLGLRPSKSKSLQEFNIDTCLIPIATELCFHMTPPNFKGLYKID